MNLTLLSDAELVDGLKTLAQNERAATVAVLEYLIELESRGVYRDLGYSSLFDYCTRALHYSGASAYRRIAAARCLKSNREIGDLQREGKLTLCTVATAAKTIQDKTTTVTEIVGYSKRQVESLIAYKEPVERKLKEVVRPVTVRFDTPLFTAPKEERVELRFSLSKAEYQRLEQARARLSNSLSQEQTLEAVLGKLLEHFLKPSEHKPRAFNPDLRRVSKAVKDAVYKRDGNQCCYTAPDGVRCTARHYLQIDHIVPFAAGGKTELSNLRLLCSAHNQLMAERHFGKELIQKCISLEHRL